MYSYVFCSYHTFTLTHIIHLNIENFVSPIIPIHPGFVITAFLPKNPQPVFSITGILKRHSEGHSNFIDTPLTTTSTEIGYFLHPLRCKPLYTIVFVVIYVGIDSNTYSLL